jgi:hypothetical protein
MGEPLISFRYIHGMRATRKHGAEITIVSPKFFQFDLPPSSIIHTLRDLQF